MQSIWISRQLKVCIESMGAKFDKVWKFPPFTLVFNHKNVSIYSKHDQNETIL